MSPPDAAAQDLGTLRGLQPRGIHGQRRRQRFGLEDLPRISHGQGSYLYDEAGSATSTVPEAPPCFASAMRHPEVNAAVARQMDSVAYGYRYLFTSSALEALSEIC